MTHYVYVIKIINVDFVYFLKKIRNIIWKFSLSIKGFSIYLYGTKKEIKEDQNPCKDFVNTAKKQNIQGEWSAL